MRGPNSCPDSGRRPGSRLAVSGRRRFTRRHPSIAGLILAVFVLTGGCGDDDPSSPPPTPPPATLMPDFTLTDVNPNSATTDAAVSPRQYLQRISAWYFGHST